jgi:hypothetical protein
MTASVIYLPENTETQRWARICVEWCERKGYRVVSLVVDDSPDGRKWRDVVAMMARGDVEVCVVPRWDHMPPDRVPRVEVIAEDVARDTGAGPRRPHIL